MHETDESRIFGRGLLGITLSKWQTLSLLACRTSGHVRLVLRFGCGPGFDRRVEPF